MSVSCLILFCVFLFAAEVDAFYQNDYRIQHHRLEISSFNQQYLRDVKASLISVNRTARAVNVSFQLLVDLDSTAVYTLQAYKFASNEYRLFPMRIALDLCTILKEHPFGTDDLFKHTNLRVTADSCSFTKGYYYVNKWRPDETKFPPYIPAGDYKIVLNITYKSDALAEGHWYGSVKTIEKWMRI